MQTVRSTLYIYSYVRVRAMREAQQGILEMVMPETAQLKSSFNVEVRMSV